MGIAISVFRWRKLRFKASEPFGSHIPKEGQFQGSPLHLEQCVLPLLDHKEIAELPPHIPTPAQCLMGSKEVCPCTSGFSPWVPKWLHTDCVFLRGVCWASTPKQVSPLGLLTGLQTSSDPLSGHLGASRKHSHSAFGCLGCSGGSTGDLSLITSGMKSWQQSWALLSL